VVVVVGAVVVVVGGSVVVVGAAVVVVVVGAAVVVVVAFDLRVVVVGASEVVVVEPAWSGLSDCLRGAAPASPISAPATTPLVRRAVPAMAKRRLMRLWRSIRSLRPDRFWNPVRNNYRKATISHISRKRCFC
jgi:hypothetical protein